MLVAFELVRRRARVQLLLQFVLVKESNSRVRETFVTSFTGNSGGRVGG